MVSHFLAARRAPLPGARENYSPFERPSLFYDGISAAIENRAASASAMKTSR